MTAVAAVENNGGETSSTNGDNVKKGDIGKDDAQLMEKNIGSNVLFDHIAISKDKKNKWY